MLADAEDAAEGLLLGRPVPPGVDDDHLGSHGEVEAEAAAAKRGEQDAGFVVAGEFLDGFVSSWQGHLAVVL